MRGGLMDGRPAASSTPERGAATPLTPDEPHSSEAPAASIEPEEVRAIRKRLGLSQAEAGKLLGGGPRAFTKYEAGTVKPAAAVVTLLRLLEHNPDLMEQIRDPKSPPMTPSLAPPSPFQISGEHIERFNQQLFPELLRHLLHAEAHASRLPADGIHVSSNVTAPDGGEDGRIEWQGGVGRTPHLPCRFNQFQLKAGPITPAQAGKDVLRRGQVKPMVRKVLEDGGHYRMLCAHRYTQKAIESRTQRILEAVRDAGVPIDDSQITFWGAEQIADWANQHPTVAIWAKEHTQPGVVRPFCSWTRWASHPDHDDSPWVPDERLPPLRDRLRELATPQSIVRLVGSSGIGKSRLALEALGSESGGHALNDLVMYVDESQADTSAILQTVEALANTRARAVVVVDRCSPKTHRILVGSASRAGSQLSLLTIDDDIRATMSGTTIKVDDAPLAVVKAIIGQLAPNLPSLDHQRLEHFSEGFPRIAFSISRAWLSSQPIAHAEDDDIVNAFVLGRQPTDPGYMLKSAMLLAAFGVVGIDDDGQLSEIASFRDDLSIDGLRIGINRLLDRDVIRRKGRFGVIQPRPIAMRLAERQWRDWNPKQWERLMTSDGNRHLKSLRTTAARALARINTTSTAISVARHLCLSNGPPIQSDVLPTLAELAPNAAMQMVERVLSSTNDLADLPSDTRRHVVRALERIVFHVESFRQAAPFLLRLAAFETETCANNATGTFIGLFRVHLGNTAADGDARLKFLRDVMVMAGVAERQIVVDALIECLTPIGWRIVGAEVQGSRPAMSSWLPPTKDVETRYVTGCLSLLASIAAQEHPSWPVERARSGLGERLRSWIDRDYMDAIERVVRQVSFGVESWPEAVESLGHTLMYDTDSQNTDVIQRVEALWRELLPKSLEGRIHLLVTAMPWDFPPDAEVHERGRRQEEALRSLALDLAEAPQVLESALPQLCRGQQRKALIFGETLGSLQYQFKPRVWRRWITRATFDVPMADRNLDLLVGYFVGISRHCPRLAAPLKKRLTQSSSLALAFPRVCGCLGVAKRDIDLAVTALEGGILAPSALVQWTIGGALRYLQPSDVAPLLDALLALRGDDALAVTLDLITAYGIVVPDKLNGLRLQMRTCLVRCAHSDKGLAYRLEQLAGWMLAKGRQDAHARATAIDLAKAMVEGSRNVGRNWPSSVVRKLLSGFPEVVWPSIGAAIVADRGFAMRMVLTLGTPYRRDYEAPILSLPVETLFSWCRTDLDSAPAFTANVLPVLAQQGDEQILHPTLSRLIDEFGEREDVLSGLESNIRNFSWMGSTTGYYQQFLGPLDALVGHSIASVRHWAARMTRELRIRIENARDDDAELDVEWDI